MLVTSTSPRWREMQLPVMPSRCHGCTNFKLTGLGVSRPFNPFTLRARLGDSMMVRMRVQIRHFSWIPSSNNTSNDGTCRKPSKDANAGAVMPLQWLHRSFVCVPPIVNIQTGTIDVVQFAVSFVRSSAAHDVNRRLGFATGVHRGESLARGLECRIDRIAPEERHGSRYFFNFFFFDCGRREWCSTSRSSGRELAWRC
jgi:hypothetical protein